MEEAEFVHDVADDTSKQFTFCKRKKFVICTPSSHVLSLLAYGQKKKQSYSYTFSIMAYCIQYVKI
ncbi:hypothetical protein GCM10011585_35270 [Edaphobacter dinghuensis]|uniref:Uncharacterized protein n=1 Tax=Edaphobacter dinghuensis TaxID=1560005 RepID=A0A917MAI4_9BACT|nr:hypothetical protein GCM10011585_35270 [Edaphobacter dinghuensis]